MKYEQLKRELINLGFADESELEEFGTVVTDAINRAITEINLTVAPIIGTYEIEQDGVTMEESDLYFINLNPIGSEDEWEGLFKSLQNYLYMVLIPDENGNYYVDLYDQLVNENGQSNVVLARCGFTHQWSYSAEDEIVFRGVGTNNMMFLGTDSPTGDYELNTPLSLQFSNNVRNAYTAYLKSLFGASNRDRINCIVVPSVDEQEFYFVNVKDGSYLGIMKM